MQVSYRGPDGAEIALALHSGEVLVVETLNPNPLTMIPDPKTEDPCLNLKTCILTP